jgi:hypothetical protein
VIDQFLGLTLRQYEGALRMLHQCIENCDDDRWNAPVDQLHFCQAAFHALWFTEVYLIDDVDAMKQQPFHLEHKAFFADYDADPDRHHELKHDRDLTLAYLLACRVTAAQVLAKETEQSLAATSQLEWMGLTRAELHVYNIRHLHHHAAQLSLHLKQTGGQGAEWVGSGWDDLD